MVRLDAAAVAAVTLAFATSALAVEPGDIFFGSTSTLWKMAPDGSAPVAVSNVWNSGDIHLDHDDQVLFFGPGLRRQDPETLALTTIWPDFEDSPQAIDVEDDGNILVGSWPVNFPYDPGVMRIDPVAGTSSGAVNGSLHHFLGLEPLADGSFYASSEFGSYLIAPDGSQIESGLPIHRAGDLTRLPDGRMVYVNRFEDTLWRFDPVRRIRTDLTPGAFQFLRDTVGVDDEGIAYVAGQAAGETDHKLFRVDTNTGQITVFADTAPASFARSIVVVRRQECIGGGDDDGDGLIDLADPDCRDLRDPTELPDCSDGYDVDRDGFVDYPEDPGCSGPLDPDERGSAPCDDRVDADGDGWAAYPGDPGCSSPADLDEIDPTLVCDDGIDQDGDGFADFPHDPGCSTPEDASEQSDSFCDDGIDNDGDGHIDFPDDPGCASPEGVEDPACNDGVDNENDGTVDADGGPNGKPADPNCPTASKNSEGPHCLPCGIGVTFDTGDVWSFAYGTSGGPALVHVAASDGQQTIVGRLFGENDLRIDELGRVLMPASLGSSISQLLRRAPTSASSASLSSDFPGPAIAVDLEHDGTIVVATENEAGSSDPSLFRVDPATGTTTPFPGTPPALVQSLVVGPSGHLWVSSEVDGLQRIAPDGALVQTVPLPGPPGPLALGPFGGIFALLEDTDAIWRYDPADGSLDEVASGVFDAVTDIDAIGADLLVTGTRTGEAAAAIYRLDLVAGAVTETVSGGALVDPATTTAVRAPRCDDGLDNDGDGLTDADDPGCADALDATERSAALCDNGIDDDGDGFTDFPADPGCKSPDWLEDPGCDDGLDNDGDGGIDWDGGPGGEPADPQCVDRPWQGIEAPKGCGLGPELLAPLALLAAARRGRRPRRRLVA